MSREPYARAGAHPHRRQGRHGPVDGARAVRAALVLATLGAGFAPPVVAADGSELFDVHCIACHGPDARGIEDQGVDLVASPFVARESAAGLVEFLKAGRVADDPASVTGRPMPGFYWVAESELEALAAFLKDRSGGG